MEELPHIMQAMRMEETPTPNMQEAMGMDQVTRMEHPHINKLHMDEVTRMEDEVTRMEHPHINKLHMDEVTCMEDEVTRMEDEVTRMEHPHINKLHLADISLMIMNPMVITGDVT
jgi:hypothetical protein